MAQNKQENKQSNKIEMQIPAENKYLSLVRSLIDSLAKTPPALPEKKYYDVMLCVSEVFSNAVNAHKSAKSSKKINLKCQLKKNSLEIEITDRGRGFDADSMQPEDHDIYNDRGRGLFLIQQNSDDYKIKSSSRGTKVVLVFTKKSS